MAILVPKQCVERLGISTPFSCVLDTKMATSSGGTSPYKRLNVNCCKDAFLTTKYFLPVIGFLEVCLLHTCISLCTIVDQVRERVQTSASGAPMPINQVPTAPIFYRFHFKSLPNETGQTSSSGHFTGVENSWPISISIYQKYATPNMTKYQGD